MKKGVRGTYKNSNYSPFEKGGKGDLI